MARVLHLIASTHRRGAETFGVELAEHLRGVGHEVRVMAVVSGDDPAPLDVEVAGSSRLAPAGARRVLDAARWADVVVSFGSISLLTGAAAARRWGRPFVYRNIGDPSIWGQARLSGVRIGAPLRTAAQIVALYPGAARTLEQRYHVDPARVRVIPRGVPAERFVPADTATRDAARERLGLAPDRRWVAFVGALSPEKDPMLALDALALLDDGVGLVVAGGGPLTAEFTERAAGLGDRVRLLGVVDDVRPVYAASDALVLPSRTEGIPGSAIEASLSRLPVVAFDVGGVASVVLDGRTGRLAPSRQPRALADAVSEALDEREIWGEAARRHALDHFSMAAVGAAWESVIDHLTTTSERPRARVLQVSASTERRGAELFAAQLGDRLVDAGFAVTNCSVGRSDGRRGLPFRTLGPGRFRPSTLVRLYGEARRSDVVIAHGGAGLWPTALTATLAGRPFVYRGIGEPTFWGAVPFGRLRIGLPLRRAARVVPLWDEAARQFAEMYRLDPDRVVVVPNGTRADRHPPTDPHRRARARDLLGLEATSAVPLIGYLGALSPEKRPDWAIRLLADETDAHLALIGSGPLEAELRLLADEVAPGRVHFTGAREQPAELLAGLDVLVLPSATEGMPASLIEAALVGIPTVSTDVGAVRQLTEDLRSGVVVGRDDVAAFGDAVHRVLTGDESIRPDRDAALRYDIATVAHAWVELLDHLVPPAR